MVFGIIMVNKVIKSGDILLQYVDILVVGDDVYLIGGIFGLEVMLCDVIEFGDFFLGLFLGFDLFKVEKIDGFVDSDVYYVVVIDVFMVCDGDGVQKVNVFDQLGDMY